MSAYACDGEATVLLLPSPNNQLYRSPNPEELSLNAMGLPGHDMLSAAIKFTLGLPTVMIFVFTILSRQPKLSFTVSFTEKMPPVLYKCVKGAAEKSFLMLSPKSKVQRLMRYRLSVMVWSLKRAVSVIQITGATAAKFAFGPNTFTTFCFTNESLQPLASVITNRILYVPALL